MMGSINVIAFTSLDAKEEVDARQYAGAWFEKLTQPGRSNPTAIGRLFQFVLLCGFVYINNNSVKTVAKTNNISSACKFSVP
ncbi:aspartate:proton symporter, partial [Erwinia amylovora]|nr:aspartate:proton symporter [Erwinia amylovora]